MTKKHFIALANAIKAQKGTPQEFSYRQIIELAIFCKSQNSRFNESLWLAFVKGQCGPNGGELAKLPMIKTN